MRKLLFIILFVIAQLNLFSQTGQPFINNFPPYKIGVEGGQIWSAVQSPDGKIYFGGNDGVYEFDGEDWRKIELDKKYKAVRTLVLDKNGKIFVGSVGDFGYLSPDKNGKLKYVSLIKLVNEADRQFTDIWTSFAHKDNIYFCTNEKIIIYNPLHKKKIRIIKDKYFFLMYKPRNEIFVSVGGEGLMKIDDDKLVSLNLPEKIYPYQILPYENDKYLIAGTRQGLLVYNPKAKNTSEILTKNFFDPVEIIKTDSALAKNHIYTGGTRLHDGNFAVGTIGKGIFIIDKKGKILNNIDKQKGLQSQTVHILFTDFDQNLWAGLTYGISYLETNSAFMRLDERNGIQGSIYDVIRFQGNFFVNTNLGIFYYANSKFIGIKNLSESGLQVFMPTIVKPLNSAEKLIVSTVRGMFEIKNSEALLINDYTPSSILVSEADSSQIYFTSDFALLKFKAEKNNFTAPDTLLSFTETPLILAQEKNKLWMLEAEKILMFDINSKTKTYFNKNEEIKGIEFTGSEKINGKNIFYTKTGNYYFETGKFKKYNIIPAEIEQNSEIRQSELLKNKIISLYRTKSGQNKFGIFELAGKSLPDTVSYKRISEFESFYAENNKQIWIISPNTVYAFNSEFKRQNIIKHKTLIRKIKIGRDSVIFDGTNFLVEKNDTFPKYISKIKFQNSVSYNFNDISFTVAMPFFEGESSNMYSYRLVGSKDKSWSEWTFLNTKEYTNLSEGTYTFQVKGRNIYGTESPISEFEFYVAPPFYRTVFAYIVYFVLAVLLVYLIIKLNLRRLEAENKRLDAIVKERTAEISQQKEEIQTQAENLKEINEALSQKNEEINQQNEEIRTIADNLQFANDEIVNINENLAIKNKHITDSINYAKRIQKAILTENEYISKIIPESFIFLKPKETVSGDFYWYNIIQNHFVFAAVDCTGHGVPGAFMSMLGYAFLNEIVSKKEVTKTNQVLELLRDNIVKTLNQSAENTNRDGMDIALCAVNLETGIMQYSGAHNPVFIVRSGGFVNEQIKPDEKISVYKNKLLVIKADKMPVAFSRNQKSFTNHEISLQKNDIIYVFSDGIIDQTGGPENRKFMIENFKNLIINNSHLPMKQQRQNISEAFENWKGDKNKQLDDILVLGFKMDMIL